MTPGAPCMVTVARAPPQIGGTPTVMYELLRHFPKGSVVLVTKHQGGRTSADDRVLDVPTVRVARAGASVYPTLFQLLLMPLTFVEMLLAARRARPGSILAVFPSLDFLLCSLVLGRLTNAPVFVYLHDCVVETAGNAVGGYPLQESGGMRLLEGVQGVLHERAHEGVLRCERPQDRGPAPRARPGPGTPPGARAACWRAQDRLLRRHLREQPAGALGPHRSEGTLTRPCSKCMSLRQRSRSSC